MRDEAPGAAELQSLSREFALVCDAAGVVAWCDGRCRAALGIAPGDSLAALAPAGTQAKLAALLEQGAAFEVRDWEVTLVVRGVPVAIAFSARPRAGGMLVVGHLVPEAYVRAIEQLSASMQEVLSLNREVVAQKRELQRRHDQALRVQRELALIRRQLADESLEAAEAKTQPAD